MKILNIYKYMILFFITIIPLYSQTVVNAREDITNGYNIKISVLSGINWQQPTQFSNTIPQMAFWIENNAGAYLMPIYVTRAFGQQKMKGMPANFKGVYRRYSLPYWLTRQYTLTKKYITQKSPLPNAVSQATPQDSFTIVSKVPKSINEGFIYCEINNMGDTNQSYTDKLNGQPSLIYRGYVNFTKKGVYKLELFALSNPNKESSLLKDFKTITTAKSIVNSITVTVEK